MLAIFFILVVFLLGFYYCLTQKRGVLETFLDKSGEIDENCPNLLIKRGEKYVLQNTRKVMVPGVNPVEFNSLDEYEEYIIWQRSQKIDCPVLFLEHAYNTQGHPVYFVSPNAPFSAANSMPEYTPTFKDEICRSDKFSITSQK